MTFEQYKIQRDLQNEIVNSLSDELNKFPKGEMGLISDEIKKTEHYKSLNRNFNIEFSKLRQINQIGMKLYKKEIQKEHQQKRANKIKLNQTLTP